MNRKIKDALTLGIAAAFVLMFALWSICKSDDAVSESERRPLKQFPTLNVEEVLSGRFQSNFESYTLDQFPLRDELRTLKALSVHDLFGEKDNNGIYVADGYAAKLDDTIHEDSLDHAADRFRYVYETYLKDTGANIYLSVIPDKNCFLAAENGYPAMDYDRFLALMREKVDFAQFVDLTDTLSLGSYYRTDLHWRQEALLPTAQALADAMGVSLTEDFTEVTLDTPFYGVYRGQSALPMDDRDDAELAVAMESHLESRELMAQIMALPPPDGELFLRRYLYGETAAQLGARFAMPAATVRTRLHRARLALQKLLKEG